MPTVLRVGGFEFSFYANDHEPAHVHVRCGDGVAVIYIASGTVRETTGNVRKPDLARAKSLVHQHRGLLQAAWNRFERKKG